MGVRRRLLREFLASLKYIKNLSQEQIHASLWRGEATLCNLELEPRQLQQLLHEFWPPGLEILRATVKEVHIRIPWYQLMTQSVLVMMQDVEIEAAVHCEDEEDWREVVAQMQRKLVSQQQERTDQAFVSSLVSNPAAAFEQLRQRVVDGSQLQVSSAQLILFSGHPRHHPSHGSPAAGEEEVQELQEVLRITGSDIFVSPSDIHRGPCLKLKDMFTFDAKSRLLTLNKFMKCRDFRVSPGRTASSCPHVVDEFLEDPVPLACHVIQSFPSSDGTSMCPFTLKNAVLFEFQNSVHVRGCECQLRAFLALVADIGRLEEWRLDETLINAGSSGAAAAAVGNPVAVASPPHCSDLQNTSSIARTMAKGGQHSGGTPNNSPPPAPLREDTSPAAESPPAFWLGQAIGAPCEASATPGKRPPRLTNAFGEYVREPEVSSPCEAASPWTPENGGLTASNKPIQASEEEVAATRVSAITEAVEAVPCLPKHCTPAASIVSTGPVEGAPIFNITGSTFGFKEPTGSALAPDAATSTLQRQTSGEECRPLPTIGGLPGTDFFAGLGFEAVGGRAVSGSSGTRDSMPTLLLPTFAFARPEPVPMNCGPLENTSAVARTFAQGPECRRPKEADRKADVPSAASALWKTLSHAKPTSLLARATRASLTGGPARAWKEATEFQDGEEDGEEATEFQDAAEDATPAGLGADGVGVEDRFAQAFMRTPLQHHGEAGSDGGGDDEEHGQLFASPEARLAAEAEEEQQKAEECEECIIDSDEEEHLDDADEFLSVHSVASGDVGGTLAGGIASTQARWLKPVLKWLGTDKPSPPVSQDWPAMQEVVKEVGIRFSHLVVSLTLVEGLQPDASVEMPERLPTETLELRLNEFFWSMECGLSLTEAQAECVQRLKSPAEDRAHLQKRVTSEELGPHCLPQQLRASQHMHWPSAVLMVRSSSSEVELMHPLKADHGRQPQHQMPAEPMLSFSVQPRSAPGLVLEAPEWVSHTWPLQFRFNSVRFCADQGAWNSVKACLDRCKPSLLPKVPLPSLVPPRAPQNCEEVFPVESMFVELIGCEVMEPPNPEVMRDEKRWPMHFTIPRMSLRSHSDIWDFSDLLSRWEGAFPLLASSSEAEADAASAAARAAGGPGQDEVTIPKEMFDHLVDRAAQATFKESQVVAAREELQKAYIALAGRPRGGSTQAPGSARGLGVGEELERSPPADSHQASAAEATELELLRHKCAQLESSLRSQGLAQRRLETELASYQAMARDELRQLLSARAPAPRFELPLTANAWMSA